MSNKLQHAKSIKMKEVKYPCRAEIKYDGVRMYNIGNKWYTRKGKLLPFKTIKFDASMYMLDIEITLESGKMKDRQAIIGMTNSLMAGGDVDESLFKFRVFDSMLADHYTNTHCHDTLTERSYRTRNLTVSIPDDRFVDVMYKDCNNKMELETYYNTIISQGYEGLVIKHYSDKYQFGKKNKHWGKLKARHPADLLCTEMFQGEGKYEGMIGALELKGTIDGKDIVVSVGSGMTDEDRSKGDYIGKTIEVLYSHITQNAKTGIYSLNQPVFVCVREDK